MTKSLKGRIRFEEGWIRRGDRCRIIRPIPNDYGVLLCSDNKQLTTYNFNYLFECV